MKKLLIILGLICLLLDLADDGCIGQGKYIAPKSASTSALQLCVDELPDTFAGKATAVALLTARLVDTNGWLHNRPAAKEVPHPNKIVYCSHFFSSGGIPS